MSEQVRKIYVFGTGKTYIRYKKILQTYDILNFLDNNSDKQGILVDGAITQLPDKVDYQLCDAVIVTVRKPEQVLEQLRSLGVPENKIILCDELKKKLQLGDLVSHNGSITDADDTDSEKKKVLICAHEFSRTGVPVVAMNAASLLQKKGCEVVLAALNGGNLLNEIEARELKYTEYLNLYSTSDCIAFGKKFDLIILCTACLYSYGVDLAKSGTKVVWWMHEASLEEHSRLQIPLIDNITFWGGGKQVVDSFHTFYPNLNMKEELYFIPDISSCEKKTDNDINGSITFALIGTFCKRKGQDIFLEAISAMTSSLRRKCKFIFVGNPASWKDLKAIEYADKYPEIELEGEVSEEELILLYRDIDVVVSPSRTDPMPIVVSQAMQNKCACIVSDKVGQAQFIESLKNGIVFSSENVEELKNAIEYLIHNPNRIMEFGEKSYSIYERYFSEQNFWDEIKDIIYSEH